MSALSRHRAEWLWAGLLLAVPLLLFVDTAPPPEAGTDTWGTGPDGKRAFFTLAQRLLGDVRRHSARLLPPPEAGTLCLVGPARHPDAGEWRELLRWVAAGHTLLFAARQDDPAVEIPVGLRVRTDRPGDPAAEEAVARSAPVIEVDEVLRGGRDAVLALRSPAWIEGAAPGAWVAARRDGRPVIVSQAVGRGGIVVVASDEIFDNAALVQRGAAVVPFRLLERVRQGAVVFDESLSGSGGTHIFGLLFGPSLRALTVQLLVVAVVFGWSGARGLGPVSGGGGRGRRRMTEHAVGLGRLCYKSRAGAALVAAYLEYFRREVGGRTDRRSTAEAMGRAQEVVDSGSSTEAAAAAVSELARLRQEILRPGGRA